MNGKVWLVIAVVMLLLAGIACDDNDNDNVVIEPDRLEYLATPTPISVGADDADVIIQDVRDTRQNVDSGLDVTNAINCRLGFSTCLTVTGTVTPTVDLWGSD